MAVALRSPAVCHPTRPGLARGLCSSCYNRQWRALNRAPRPTPSFEAEPPLPLAPPIASYTFTVWPTVCPKCGNALLECFGREAHCPPGAAGCGYTGYLVRATA